MDKISRVGPPEATGVSDGFYSFVVRLSEPPAAHWVYVFKTITKPTKGDIDPDHVVFDAQQGLLFASEERLVPEWMRHIDLWILAANAQVEADDIIQEIYLEVYKNFHKFEYRDPNSFYKWIVTVIEEPGAI